MCDRPVPCQCTLDRRAELLIEHVSRSDALRALAFRLSNQGHISDDELVMLGAQAEQEWDDAIHIASPDDPLRSLCGRLGRNLADLPERPDSWAGCWTCLERAEKLLPASGANREVVAA